MKKILIIELRPGIGDLCMFIPRFHEIKQKFQKSNITLLTKTRTRAKEILKYDQNINQIEFIDEGGKKKSLMFLLSLFKKNKFDIVFSYQYGPKYLKYIFFSKIFGSQVFFLRCPALVCSQRLFAVSVTVSKPFPAHVSKLSPTRRAVPTTKCAWRVWF